jgi:hypothetical protein
MCHCRPWFDDFGGDDIDEDFEKSRPSVAFQMIGRLIPAEVG